MAIENPDLIESSRLLARALLELAGIFEDLYVPDDPNVPINQDLHNEVACALRVAHVTLADYVARVYEADGGALDADEIERAAYRSKFN